MAARSELRILLPQRPGGGVTRIRQRFLPLLFELLVVASEIGFGDEDFAANLQTFESRIDFQRKRAHRAHVWRDVVAAHAIASCRTTSELAVFVEQIDRNAIDFQLRFIFD